MSVINPVPSVALKPLVGPPRSEAAGQSAAISVNAVFLYLSGEWPAWFCTFVFWRYTEDGSVTSAYAARFIHFPRNQHARHKRPTTNTTDPPHAPCKAERKCLLIYKH